MTIAARPTTYRGIDMRSRTEARFAAFLDRVRLVWEYEPRAYASSEGQYLPDFEIQWVRPLFVEVKGTLDNAAWPALQRRMRIVRASVPNAGLAVALSDYDRLLLDSPGGAELGKAWPAFFGTCPAGHATFGFGQARPNVWCHRCSYSGPPTAILRHFAEVA